MAYNPSGRPAVRLNRLHQDSIREKIRAAELVARLSAFAMGETVGEGKRKRRVFMSSDQVRAANILLAKCIPDLQRHVVEGDLGVTHRGAVNLTLRCPQGAPGVPLAAAG
jgi:hypothetical protein